MWQAAHSCWYWGSGDTAAMRRPSACAALRAAVAPITATKATTAFANSRAITINNGALATYNIGNINGPTLSGAITGTGGLILQSSTATARTFTLSNTGNTFQGPLVIGGSSTSIITAAVASLADSASANGAIRLGNATQLGTFQWSTSATGALTLSNRQFDLAGTTGGGAIDNSNATVTNIITVNTNVKPLIRHKLNKCAQSHCIIKHKLQGSF